MRTLVLIVFALVTLPDRPNPTPREMPKPFHEQLVGEWRLVKAVIGGEAKGKERTVFVFTKTDIRVRENDRQWDGDGDEDATYTLDETRSPIHIEITPRPQGNDPNVRGIIKLDGEKLTLCFSHSGKGSRPTEFTSTAGTSNALMILERIKK
jgi:uncharacterized protein (TIGR03067 family)